MAKRSWYSHRGYGKYNKKQRSGLRTWQRKPRKGRFI